MWSVGLVTESNRKNNFAISSEGVGEAMLRSSSALAAANNTIDESIALAAAMNTQVQDPDVVGSHNKVPTLKTAISVKSQRWSRPRKGFINAIMYQAWC